MNKEAQVFLPKSILPNCLNECKSAVATLDNFLRKIIFNASSQLKENGKISNENMKKYQYSLHGLAWYSTYIESLHQLLSWAEKLSDTDLFTDTERLILQIGFGEYLSQIIGGIQMSQNEIVRPKDVFASDGDINELYTESILNLINNGNIDAARLSLTNILIEKIGTPNFTNNGLDEEYELIRDQFYKFSKDKIVPSAHEWHLKDQLIPIEIIRELAEMGVFSLTIPEEYDGLGMTKTSMCVVSEELSRGYIGVGSLATRSEIAAELILCGGTKKQKEYWLPKIGTASILPTAVFTEPNTGSDLGSLQTRAVLKNDHYIVNGNKTWITHAARTDIMTMLVRTDQNSSNYSGLSMLIGEKERGSCDTPFPSQGIKGTEIEVLGYRGMKEYEMSFDDFKVKKENLLGENEGQGFKQLMQTFESARIQTAARAIGVAHNALDLGLQYAVDRKQFGKNIIEFPRVYNKIANMAVEITIARQLTYHSSKEKDNNRRCDLEAGMAKLLSAKIAWSAADNSLQIHGGNGFALEYSISRVLCDARILNIFEGAAEIQAQVIAKRILEKGQI